MAYRGRSDGDRSKDMRKDELTLLSSLHDQKEAFRSAYLQQWQAPYVEWLQRRQSEHITSALDFIASLPEASPKSWHPESWYGVHGRRRIVAIYHQEMELCLLEPEVYRQVQMDGLYIGGGAWCVRPVLSDDHPTHLSFSVNRLLFKRTYGF